MVQYLEHYEATKTHVSRKVSMPHLWFQPKCIGHAMDTTGTWILHIKRVKWKGIGYNMILIIAYIEMHKNNEVYKHII